MARKIIQPKTLNDPRPRYSQGILNQRRQAAFYRRPNRFR